MKKISTAILIAFTTFVLYSCIAPDHFIVTTRLNAPVVTIPISPGESYIWIEGEWFWNASNYTWRNGYWTSPIRSYHYISGQWKPKGGGWYWKPGRWQK